DWPGGPPILRGSLEPGFARWDRWQFGVLAAFGNMTTPFNTTTGPVFGAFVGYNWQWSELVVGWDLAYKYPSVLDASESLTTFKLVDYATLRGRAGYAVGPSCLMQCLAPRLDASILATYPQAPSSEKTTLSMSVSSLALAWIGQSRPVCFCERNGNTWAFRGST